MTTTPKPIAPADLHPRRYLLVSMLVVAIALAVVAGWTVRAARAGRLPPVPLTGSISFDEKMEWLWRRGERHWDVLAVGSSMTLNNLDCTEVAARLPAGVELTNAASWSLKIADARALVDYLVRVHRPRAVVMVIGPMDFYVTRAKLSVKPDDLDFYRGASPYPLLVARWFDPFWYYGRTDQIAEQRASRASYTSLDFDRWGGVPLEVRWPQVAAERWNQRPLPAFIDARQYGEFERLVSGLAEARVRLVCAQTPIRDDAFADCDQAGVRAHWARVAEILAAHGYRFHNLHGRLALEQACWADYSHLNAEGARRFTDALLDQCGPDEIELIPGSKP